MRTSFKQVSEKANLLEIELIKIRDESKRGLIYIYRTTSKSGEHKQFSSLKKLDEYLMQLVIAL